MKRLSVLFVGLLAWAGIVQAMNFVVAFAFPEGKLPAEGSDLTVTTTANVPNTQSGSEPRVTTKRYRGGTTQAIVVDYPIERSALSGLTKVSHTLTYTTAEGETVTLEAANQHVLKLPYASHAGVEARAIAQGDTSNFNVTGAMRVNKNLTVTSLIGPNANTADLPVESIAVSGEVIGVQSMVIGTPGATSETGAQDSNVEALTVKGDLTLTSDAGVTFPMGQMTGKGTVPIDTIIVWLGEGSPNTQTVQPGKGWVLCDGNYGTPDLRGRFLMGTMPGDDVKLLDKGGKTEVVIPYEALPTHEHDVKVRTPRLYTYCWPLSGDHDVGSTNAIWHGQSTKTVTTTSAGHSSPEATPNLPRYFAVSFYQWKGVSE